MSIVTAIAVALSMSVSPGANPALIDPMDPAAGDFLDLDLDMYRQLGLEAYLDSSYPMAARYFLTYLSRNCTDENAIYNLACCYGLMEEPELAAIYLLRAVSAGFTDMNLIMSDPDFDAVREHQDFRDAIELLEGYITGPPDYDGARLMLDGSAAMPCLYSLPEGYDESSGALPLLVGLHGYGDSPENFMRLWGLFDSPDFIYACPRAPYPVLINGTIGWSWFTAPGSLDETIRLDMLSVEWVMTAIESMKDRFEVSEVYLIGFSQGCGLTWFTGLTRAEEFAGLIGLGGRLDTAYLPDSIIGDASDLRAFAANGTQDLSVRLEEAESAAAFLEEHGVEVTVSSWDGDHRIYRGILLEAQEWMENSIRETASQLD